MTAVTVINKKINLFQHVKYEHLIAGVSGGVTATLVLHPLDLLKIRFAVNDGICSTLPKYKGINNALSTIFREEGFTGLYRGVVPNLWGSATSWGLYFFIYNSIKTRIQEGDPKISLSASTHMLAAAQAGIFTLFITNPLWVVKTRMCLQCAELSASNVSDNKIYRGMVDALHKIYITEGFRGFYKGFTAGILGVSHGALQFMTYEEMKNRYNNYRFVPINTKLSTIEYLSFAAVSKIIAATATYPYQVLRARLQQQHQEYSGIVDCIRRTWKYESYRGFYKGLGTNLLRVTPATMITFVTYENVSYYLLNRNAKPK